MNPKAVQNIAETSVEFLDSLDAVKGESWARGVAMYCNLRHALQLHEGMQIVVSSVFAYMNTLQSKEKIDEMIKDADLLFAMQKRVGDM